MNCEICGTDICVEDLTTYCPLYERLKCGNCDFGKRTVCAECETEVNP